MRGEDFYDGTTFQFFGRALTDASTGDQNIQASIEYEEEFGQRTQEPPHQLCAKLRAKRFRRRATGPVDARIQCFGGSIHAAADPSISNSALKTNAPSHAARSFYGVANMGKMVIEGRCRGYQSIP